MTVRNLVLLLGDQLSLNISSLADSDPARDVIVMGELASEATYVPHHRKKLAFIFASMRRFADALRAKGWRVEYHHFDRTGTIKDFRSLIADATRRFRPQRLIITEPGEHRLAQEFSRWEADFDFEVEVREDHRFICSHSDFSAWSDNRASLRMEFFYREMRRKTGILMENGEPAGGRWNFDAENRKRAPKDLQPPPPKRFEPDAVTAGAIAEVAETFPGGFGALTPFWFATSPEDADAVFEDFLTARLPAFGDYQDAMMANEPFLYHSLISMYLNIGFLDPLDICRRAEAVWRAGRAPLNAVEGFVRQILGWREFVRGVYWREGPDYTRNNALKASRRLPDFYWTGDTDMACMKAAIAQTQEDAYAHHIQRLMVTGNFALIAGIDPYSVHEWYLSVYADAYEWVEAPNTIGMALFADGGVVASKPYAASGAYIDRMSDYCGDCRYRVKTKTDEDSCPFNALYWDFLIRNETPLGANPRLSRIYQNWRRMDASKREAYLLRAKRILEILDLGERL